jgi:hypothetical protein
LPLGGVTAKRAQKPQYSFIITPKVGKAYLLTATSQQECDDWLGAVNKVIEDLAKRREAVRSLIQSIESKAKLVAH